LELKLARQMLAEVQTFAFKKFDQTVLCGSMADLKLKELTIYIGGHPDYELFCEAGNLLLTCKVGYSLR
jgi:hypothetical protein